MYQNPFMGYQPYDMQQVKQPAQQPINGVVRVTGIDGARAYQLPPNSVMPLFDGNEDVFYVKSTDGAGFPTIRVFPFYEKVLQQPSEAQYATKAELSEIAEAITALGEKLDEMKEAQGGKQPVRRKSAAE